MQFKQLKIIGFKSFIEPLSIDIEEGLTGIVGPNGCGKSNLLEALRWVMGETSYKTMRGEGMEDVIFSGTKARPARNMAEVTLIIDNSARDALAAYNDSDEIEINRRIERETGSSYKINGHEVRQKDVQLFFAHAASGAKSSGLVSQGRIAAIINASPEERRKLIEEAAGITALRAQRHDSELRHKATLGNLEKVDADLGEKASQMRGLKRQARLAGRYRKLTENIRNMEAELLYMSWLHARQQQERSTSALAVLQEEISRLTGLEAEAQKNFAAQQEKMPELLKAEAQASAALARIDMECEAIENKKANAERETARLTEMLETIAQDEAREKETLREAEAEMAGAKERVAPLQELINNHEQAVAEASSVVKPIREKQELAQAEWDKTHNISAQYEAEAHQLERAHEEASGRIVSIKSKLASMEQERDQLALNLQEGGDMEGLSRELEGAQRELSRAKAQAEKAGARLSELREKLGALEASHERAHLHLQGLSGQYEVLQDMLEGEGSGSVLQEISADEGYGIALLAALGEAAKAPLSSWQARGTPEQSLPDGIASLGDFVKNKKALAPLLSQIGVVSSEEAKKVLPALKTGQMLVSKEGDIWRWDGYVASAALHLGKRKEFETIKAELEEARKKAAASEESRGLARKEAEEAAREDEKARAAWEGAQAHIEELRRKHAELQKASHTEQTKFELLKSSIRHEQEQMKSNEGKLADIEKKREAQSAPPIEGAKIEAQKETLEDYRRQLIQAEAKMEGVERQSSEAKARLQELLSAQEGCERRSSHASEQIVKLQERRQKAQAELEENKKIPSASEEQYQKLMEQKGQCETRRNEAGDVLAREQEKYDGLDKTLKDCGGKLGEAREGRSAEQVRVNAAKEDLERALHNMERVQQSPEVLAEELGERAEFGEISSELYAQTEQNIDKAKAERDTMGAVNLVADSEVEELETLIAEVKKERDDVEKTLESLRQSIRHINKEARGKLMDAFEKVNQHFGTLFASLFGGGKAYLQFSGSDDPLEAELEIIATPPGKKPKTLSLLSGGEQTLTALSLLFSVFLTNPSPICVLDEADAPLDEANVARLCNMLEEIIKKTNIRFIIITHHAYTMAKANRLYGVTMQEQGVSFVASLNLKDAAQHAISPENQHNQHSINAENAS